MEGNRAKQPYPLIGRASCVGHSAPLLLRAPSTGVTVVCFLSTPVQHPEVSGVLEQALPYHLCLQQFSLAGPGSVWSTAY